MGKPPISIIAPSAFMRLFIVRLTAVLLASSVGWTAGSSQAQTPSKEKRPSLPFCIVDTGQTKCYDNQSEIAAPKPGQTFYGQDAQFSGTQTSYTLSADEKTVLDNNTGMTWMRSPNLTNTPPVRGDKMTYPAAQAWVATVNAARYGGYSDWRLPTIKELYSLFDCRGTDPSSFRGTDTSVLTPFIDPKFFNFSWGNTSLGERIIDQQYASNTSFVLNPSGSGFQKLFGVNFADGRIKGYDLKMPGGFADKTFLVQLVRGGTSYGKNDFKDNGDGAITDRATGLIWSKEDSKKSMNWQDALAWAQKMNAEKYLGHDDWRMPNVKELHSLVNYSNSPDYNNKPAIDTNFFICSSIVNEAGQADFPYYWTATTHGGYSGGGGGLGGPGGQGGPGGPGGRPGGGGGPGGGSGQANYIPFGRGLGWPMMVGRWIDVHGAGCQRSDPKIGPPFAFATVHTVTANGVTYTGYSFGPQGDAIRGLNYVRLVRGSEVTKRIETTPAR
ncbi:MAG: DUF1566 domain-containing protein [Candidatus Sumerlaeota bacterium]|nr:DUF1566 domain-containing protein [Candidatus Sumerlaeota bacterium]